MEIIKLEPAYKDYIWGGNRLVKEYGKNSGLDVTAESWELSCHPDGESKIVNGEYAGKTLTEYFKLTKNETLGEDFKPEDSFPILIKFIDALKALSIQVHPSDEYALRVEHELGKSEMWYILDCEPGAYIYYGVKQPITKEEFRAHLEDNTILDYLNKVMVKKGDCFYIEAGTIHAIGEGNVICEIQENSNTTYRVYDYNRPGKDGKPRPLHVDKALDVANLEPIERHDDERKVEMLGNNKKTELASCKYFTTSRLDLVDEVKLKACKKSFNSLLCVEGSGTIDGMEFKKGESILVPAGYGEYTVKGNAALILTTL